MPQIRFLYNMYLTLLFYFSVPYCGNLVGFYSWGTGVSVGRQAPRDNLPLWSWSCNGVVTCFVPRWWVQATGY